MKKIKLIHFFGQKNINPQNPQKYNPHPSLIILFIIFFSVTLFYFFPTVKLSPQFITSNILAHWQTTPLICDKTCLVTKIIDGDTFYCLDDKKEELRIRLIGVDTPEISHSPEANTQFWATGALLFLAENLPLQQPACLISDSLTGEKDKYNRSLFWIAPNNTTTPPTITLNERLISQWLAQTMSFPNERQELLIALEKQAIQQKLGIRDTFQRVSIFEQANKINLSPKNIDQYLEKNIYFSFKPQFYRQTNKLIEFFADKKPDYNQDFRLIIFKNNLKNFKKTGIIRPDKLFLGKKLTIYGKIKKYNKFYEVILNSPLQVTF